MAVKIMNCPIYPKKREFLRLILSNCEKAWKSNKNRPLTGRCFSHIFSLYNVNYVLHYARIM